MVQLQNTKSVIMVAPATIASNATSSSRVDTLGFRYCVIDAALCAATATNSSAKWGVLKITEADVTSVSSGSAIVALTGTTNTVTDATNGFLITANNDTNGSTAIHRFYIDLRARKRYLFVTAQGASSHSTVCIKAELSRAEEMPNTDAERGCLVSVVS